MGYRTVRGKHAPVPVHDQGWARLMRREHGLDCTSKDVQRRRVERAMFLLRATGRNVTDICFDVGFNSLGTFSRTFHDIVGESPTAFRQSGRMPAVPTCFMMAWARPSSFGEAQPSPATLE